jgi:hypothetical protein
MAGSRHMAYRFLSRKDVESFLIDRAGMDEEFRAELLSDPKRVIARVFGIGELPEELVINVVEETPDQLYIVLPADPRERGAIREARLRALWNW